MARFSFPRLCVICDAEVCARAGWTVSDYAAACADAGARFLQIRAKNAGSAALLQMTEAVLRRTSGTGTLVVVNDRADVARMAGAAGVHLGQDDLAPRAARQLVGVDACVGLSTHTREQIAAAMNEPIDYIAIGPVFGTATKATGYDAVGLARVREAAAVASARGIPVVAIGGVTADNVPDVLASGAHAVAVISDLLATGDPAARVRAYLNRL